MLLYQSPHSAAANLTQLLAIVITAFDQSNSHDGIKVISRFFALVPDYLGVSATLDTAVRCFTVHHVGRLRNDEAMVRAARGPYVEALQRLQRNLEDAKVALSSEVLCACVVLCIFEVGHWALWRMIPLKAEG